MSCSKGFPLPTLKDSCGFNCNPVLAPEISCAALQFTPCCLQFLLPGSIKDLRGLQPEEKQWLADRKQADKAAAQSISKWQGTIWGESCGRCFVLAPGRGISTWGETTGTISRPVAATQQASSAHTHRASAMVLQPEGTHLPTGAVSAAAWRLCSVRTCRALLMQTTEALR